MILVRVGQHHRIDGNSFFDQLREIRNVNAVAEQAILGEHNPAIDDEPVPGALDHHQVETDLTQTAEREKFYRSGFGNVRPHRHLTAARKAEYTKCAAGVKDRPFVGFCAMNVIATSASP